MGRMRPAAHRKSDREAKGKSIFFFKSEVFSPGPWGIAQSPKFAGEFICDLMFLLQNAVLPLLLRREALPRDSLLSRHHFFPREDFSSLLALSTSREGSS